MERVRLRTEDEGSTRWMIRPAREADAEALAQVNVRAWRRAYRGIMDEGYLAAMDPRQRAERWRERLRQPDPADLVLAAEGTDGRPGVVGYCLVRAPAGLPEPPRVGAVVALYVDPSRWGDGAGGQLHRAALRHLEIRECVEAILWVATANVRSRAFYERHRWLDDSESTGGRGSHRVGGMAIPVVRYRRPVS
ncbi:Ribosomal protein S18 acetylase RimI [Amycolatopsis marina]|uniref:Ribosomal protein S18 acetylase RimI n=1 Tax=Amycolatopsis marina TaxID=490629 RepID=A0A1I0XVK8_9PSEU|nr:GNAT family N-acetyltransferase [Amycolatopsis marina]SFB04476.1 Ribosomal protein S18 acetylase RimI [Amycolatopsis marina]